MMDISTILKYYKREDIQNEIIENAKDREVAARFEDRFGKRPDVLNYNNDILELAKDGATSLHISEERWHSPLRLNPEMRKNELDELRKGWDLVLDVDFEEWNSTKIIAKALVDALREHGIKNISCKFSGNKGFHIGVCFESFPAEVNKVKSKDLFPEGARRIASYLMDYIDNRNNSYRLSNIILKDRNFLEFAAKSGKNTDDFCHVICAKCNAMHKKSQEKKSEFICKKCDKRIQQDNDAMFMKCPSCNSFMERFSEKTEEKCEKCRGKEFVKKLNLKIDTVLISSRHMFRSPYSLHEKTGFVSFPIDPGRIMDFDRSMAEPSKVKVSQFRFLERSKASPNEASSLIIAAFDYMPTIEDTEKKEFTEEILKEAAPEAFFPPCMHNILKGIRDGKKRSAFILVNFLTMVGWPYDKIEALLYEWNKKNPEPLRETMINSQLRYHKQMKKRIMPPNCSNAMYYREFGVCTPDAFCQRIKNPANYTLLKIKMQSNAKEAMKGRQLTDDEKLKRKTEREMHKKFREDIKLKKEKGEFTEQVI